MRESPGSPLRWLKVGPYPAQGVRYPPGLDIRVLYRPLREKLLSRFRLLQGRFLVWGHQLLLGQFFDGLHSDPVFHPPPGQFIPQFGQFIFRAPVLQG